MERVSAHSAIKKARGIRVFLDGAEVEHPEVLAVVMLEELLRIFSLVAIEPLNTTRGVSHDNHFVGDVREICKSSAKWALSGCETVDSSHYAD